MDASAQTTSHELTIPNDLIGCIIRCQVTNQRDPSDAWAQIKTVNPAEGSADRQVTTPGSAVSVSLAQYLVNVRLSARQEHGEQLEQ